MKKLASNGDLPTLKLTHNKIHATWNELGTRSQLVVNEVGRIKSKPQAFPRAVENNNRVAKSKNDDRRKIQVRININKVEALKLIVTKVGGTKESFVKRTLNRGEHLADPSTYGLIFGRFIN